MHPVNTEDFGVNGMTISYNAGAGLVAGHIVKQVSPTKYMVAPGAMGTINKATFVKVRLARTSAEVSSPPAGVGVITVTAGGSTEHARKIFYRKLLTVEGHTYNWRKTMANTPDECNVSGNWSTGPNAAGFSHIVNV